jgi:hypothetical protein
MTDPLAGFQLPRNPSPIRACVNTGSGSIAAGDVVQVDTTNPPSSTQTGIGVKQCVGAGAYPYGVAIDDAAPGAQLRVQRGGLIGVVASGAISAGAVVAPDTSGQVKTTPGGVPQLGQALNATSSAGDPCLIEIDIANDA